jgi:hypothetical protein
MIGGLTLEQLRALVAAEQFRRAIMAHPRGAPPPGCTDGNRSVCDHRPGLSPGLPALTLVVELAKPPFVINPTHEMPIRWAALVGAMRRLAAIPRTTIAVFVAKIAIATPFLDFNNRRVALKNSKGAVRCGGRRFCWNPAQQGKHHQRRS